MTIRDRECIKGLITIWITLALLLPISLYLMPAFLVIYSFMVGLSAVATTILLIRIVVRTRARR